MIRVMWFRPALYSSTRRESKSDALTVLAPHNKSATTITICFNCNMAILKDLQLTILFEWPLRIVRRGDRGWSSGSRRGRQLSVDGHCRTFVYQPVCFDYGTIQAFFILLRHWRTSALPCPHLEISIIHPSVQISFGDTHSTFYLI